MCMVLREITIRVVYRDNISHLFYPEYYRKIEVSKVKNSTYLLLLSTLKSSKNRARRNSSPPVTHFKSDDEGELGESAE